LFTTRYRAANEGIDLRNFTVKKKMKEMQNLFGDGTAKNCLV
jgi:hypothetical protein